MVSSGQNWVSVQGGLSQFLVCPAGEPSPLHSFLVAGCGGDKYLADSLFEPRVPGEPGNRVERTYKDSKSWDQHTETETETVMLERTSALGLDYIYSVEFPSDANSEDIVLLSANMEHSNLPERALCRVVIGPTNVHVDSDFVKRLNTLLRLVREFEPTGNPAETDASPTKLEIPTKEEIESLENNNPRRVYQLTVLHPVVTLHNGATRLEAGVRCVDATLHTPMYPLRNVKVGSVMHPPSRIILNNCHDSASATVLEAWCRILHKDQQIKVAGLEKMKLTSKSLLFQNYWKNIYQRQGEVGVELEKLEFRLSSQAVRAVKEALFILKYGDRPEGETSIENSGPVIKCSMTSLGGTFTWTSRIHTLSLSLGRMEAKFANVIQPYKPKYYLFFKGNPDPTLLTRPAWLHLVLQGPAGTDTQFVPPIFYLRLGRSDLFLLSGLVPILQEIQSGEPSSPDTPLYRCQDSGFRSFDATLKPEKEDRVREYADLYPELLKSAIFNVKTEQINIYSAEDFSVAFSSDSMEETVSKLGGMEPGLGVIRLGLPRVQCFNTNGLIEEESLRQFPVLFPPAVWISGKNMLPLSLNLDAFELCLVGETSGLAPVSTRCTLSMNKSESKPCAFAVHADISPVLFTLGEDTVPQLMRALSSSLDVLRSLSQSEDAGRAEPERAKPETSFAVLQRSVSSVSECGTPLTYSQDTEPPEPREPGSNVSVWVQCTLPSLNFSLVSAAQKKISVCLEESSVSYDSQPTYLKVSMRMRNLTSSSECLSETGVWVQDPSKNLMISCNKELFPALSAHVPEAANYVDAFGDDGCEDHQSLTTGFFNVILTRAEVKNVHRKLKLAHRVEMFLEPGEVRFLTEIDVDVFPVDVYLTTAALETLARSLLPFSELLRAPPGRVEEPFTWFSVNNNTLPLIYFKSKRVRIFLHDVGVEGSRPGAEGSRPGAEGRRPDIFVFEADSSRVTSQVENPLSRILVNEKMYYSAAEMGLLEAPGSILEDRQYQVDFNGISVLTGSAQELLHLNSKPEKILLRTMSENPAFEWNSRAKGDNKTDPSVLLYPVLQNMNVRMNYAPAIVYRKVAGSRVQEHLVAGISLELNTYTDVRLYLSLQQLQAFSSLLEQTRRLVPPVPNSPPTSPPPVSVGPPTHPPSSTAGLQTESGPDSPVEILVPTEVLLTCSSLRLMLYEEKENLLKPCIMAVVTQPHLFSVLSPGSQKITLSLYTVQVSTPARDQTVEKDRFLDENSFPEVLLESRAGTANLLSGIKPPCFNTVVEGFLGDSVSVEAVVGRPIGLQLDPLRLRQMDLLYSRFSQYQGQERSPAPGQSRYKKVNVVFSMKNSELMFSFHSVKPMAVKLEVSDVNFTAQLQLQETRRLEAEVSCRQFTIGLSLDNLSHQLLSPVRLETTADLVLAQDMSARKGKVRAGLGRLRVHVGPHHLLVLQALSALVAREQVSSVPEGKEGTLAQENIEPEKEDDDQHFNDDLRLGTFTIEERKEGSDVPPPYRMAFNKTSLTWTYPKPRTLTRMTILPLPLTLAQDEAETSAVDCQLQFWSSNRRAWILYQHFHMREGQVTHVDLPLFKDRRSCEFAQTWRVQLYPVGNIREEIPCSLISALRVDSFFSPAMLPDFQVMFSCSRLDLELHNHLHFQGLKLDGSLAGLALDRSYPKDQSFLTAYLLGLLAEVNIWKESSGEFSWKIASRGRFGVDVTDFAYLANHTFLKPCEILLKVQIQDNFVDVFTDVGVAELTLGPFSLHTLGQSRKLWDQACSHLLTEPSTLAFVSLTQMLVVNDTCASLVFGQAGTDEKILADSKTALMYAWRSQKTGGLLHVAASKLPLIWSDSFSPKAGEIVLQLEDRSVLLVSVECVSTTLKIVKFQGLVTIVNLLKDHLEIKISNEQSECYKALSGSFERPVSFLTKPGELDLKIKYFGLFSAWSGAIALKNPRKASLVRLPYKEKGSSVTVWCNIVTETLGAHTKLLVVLSPMYVLHSLIPGQLQTHIQCEDLQSKLNLPGFDASTQLEPLHSPENKFSLSFQLSTDGPASSPPVSVSWGIIDQVRTSKPDSTSFNSLLEQILELNRSKMKLEHSLSHLADLRVLYQSGTNCQVRFEEIHPSLNTLKIRVQPKILIVNKTDVDIILSCGKEDWFLDPHSVFHPPELSATLRFGILLRQGKEYLGPPVELTDHDWTYVSLLPSYDRSLPQSGEIVYPVRCGHRTLIVKIQSEMNQAIRIITLQPMFLLTSLLERGVQVYPSVSCRKSLSILSENEETSDCVWELEPGSQVQGLLWTQLDKGDGKHEFYLSLGLTGLARTREIYIPTDSDRRQCAVLEAEPESLPCIVMSQRQDGQIHVVLLRDERPQFRLTNRLAAEVVFREVGGPPEKVRTRLSTFHTCRYIQDGYPYILEDHERNRIQLGIDQPDMDKIWSQSLDVGLSQETFVNLPGFGDVKLRVNASLPISDVSIEPVSNMEVSAKDIRARFDGPSVKPEGSDEGPGTSSASSYLIVESSGSSTRRGSVDADGGEREASVVFTVVLKVEELDVSVTDDLTNFTDNQEIVRLTLSRAAVKLLPNLQKERAPGVEEYRVRLSLDDLQVDNQMYDIGLYHFPVVVCKSEEAADARFLEVNLSIVKTAEKVFLNLVEVSLSPVCFNLEDTLAYVLQSYAKQFTSIGSREEEPRRGLLPLPVMLNVESSRNLMFLERICINEISLKVSVYASVKLFLGLEDSVLNLAGFEKQKLWCSGYSLGHTMARFYLSGALFKAGWVVGSLDVIGNPAAFTRNVTEGIKDFVSLPCEGIFNGPWGFLVGLTLGSSSLVKHVSAGTVTSITNFAKSVSRNLDMLSCDTEHWERNEAARRLKPRGLTEGVLFGLSSVGISVLGAIGGLAHHPLQVFMNEGMSPVRLVGGVGKGLMGMVAKPLGGAAELIALTGHGLLVGSGWSKERKAIKMALPSLAYDFVSSNTKFEWKLCLAEHLVCSVDASLFRDGQYTPVTCLLTRDSVVLVNEDEDAVQHVHHLANLFLEPSNEDPTLSVLKILRERSLEEKYQPTDRVAQFVLESIQFAGNRSEDTEEDMARFKPEPQVEEEYLLYINPGLQDWFALTLQHTKEGVS